MQHRIRGTKVEGGIQTRKRKKGGIENMHNERGQWQYAHMIRARAREDQAEHTTTG